MVTDLKDWLHSGKYLPPLLRDFHDQKDVFKLIFSKINVKNHGTPGLSPLKDLDWVAAHIYTIDIFLWFMAKRGYTLQRSRMKGLKFNDIEAELQQADEVQSASFSMLLNGAKNDGTAAATS